MKNIIKIILIFSFVSLLNASEKECYVHDSKDTKIKIQLSPNNVFLRVIDVNTRVTLKKIGDVSYQSKDKTMEANYYGNRLDMYYQSTNGIKFYQFLCK
ncbi:hypothetical protein N9A28_03525 [Sulfurimonas sp.]|nr:hypothetical protein [Sulfurimonas sp.]